MTKEARRRMTEREVMRSITESAGSRHMDGVNNLKISGGDALMGHTRSHPEHDG